MKNAPTYFGSLLKEARERKGITQDEMARELRMTRGSYGHMETGRRKALTPEQARIVSRRLDIDMLTLVNAMGFRVNVPGFQNETEIELIREFRRLSPEAQLLILRGLRISP